MVKKVASDFILKIDHRLEQLIANPELGSLSEKVKNVRGMLITRHNRMYYKIEGQKVIVLNLYDTRMNPHRIPY